MWMFRKIMTKFDRYWRPAIAGHVMIIIVTSITDWTKPCND